MTKKTWIISLALMAGVVVAPSYAAAATPTRSATPLRGFVINQDGRSYAAWANREIDEAVNRIYAASSRVRMTSQDRAQLINNTQASAKMMKERVHGVSADGVVTASDRQEVQNLAAAIQSEMKKVHGNLDSFWFL